MTTKFYRAPRAGLRPGGPLLLIEEGVERSWVRQVLTSEITVPTEVTTAHQFWPAHLSVMKMRIEQQLNTQGWEWDGSDFWLCARGCGCENCTKLLGMVGGHGSKCRYVEQGFLLRGPRPVYKTGTVTKPVGGTSANGYQPTTAEFARQLEYIEVEREGKVYHVPAPQEYHSYYLTAVWKRRGSRTELIPGIDNILVQES